MKLPEKAIMRAMPRLLSSFVVAPLIALGVLAGCAQTTTVGLPKPLNNDVPNPEPALGDVRTNASGDRITASDEPAATRRAKVRFELASAYYGRGQYNVALDEVKLALAADPAMAEAQNLRGLIYSAMGDAKLAEESFTRSLQLSPRNADTLHNFGWFMCQQARYDDADKLFQQALAVPLYRGITGTLRAQGVCQARSGAYAVAEKTLTRSYDLDPSNPSTAVNLSEVLLRTGGYQRARFYMQRVNSMPQVSNAETLWLAVRIEAKLGNQQGANEIGFQLRNRYPDSPQARAFEQGQFQ